VKKKLTVAALALASATVLVTSSLMSPPEEGHHGSHGGHPELAALAQTLLPMHGGEPVAVPPLLDADARAFDPERLKGRWSVVFFGFTSCPDVCPITLQVLSEVARHPASGILEGASGIPESTSGAPAGATQIVFVSVDPQHDTPKRMKSYLANFDKRFIGLTGTREALDSFAAGLGAGSERFGSGGIDHSTSLFVLDPKGRLAGVMLRPADPARIVADLNTLRAPHGATHVSHAH
jgi:protein SCO1/2